MTTEENVSSSQKRPIVVPAWLVVLGALIVYGITLNHWVTLKSLPLMARVTGWDWHPAPLDWRPTDVAPLFLLLTFPIRMFPVTWEPFLLNLFAAVCGALSLGLLAASVRLLPHDRTREQRQREGGEYALLSLPTAFLPQLFAVLMLGFQLAFWRDATASTGEMLNLLVFAFLIYCLLRHRVSQNDNWLAVFAFVYGLGTTNDWALIGFFPLFFIALIWIKGSSLFNWRLIGRMLGFGILGLLLYLLIPTLKSLSMERGNFVSLLHAELGAQSFGLRAVPRWIVAVAALPTLLPLIFAGISWPSFEGELSAAGNQLTKMMFRLLHVVFLLLALVMYFDLKFSPSLRLQEAPIGFLTFYYMGALCIGYYTGYILLVYGKAGQAWERRGPLTKVFNQFIVGLACALAVAAPIALLVQNLPHISAGRHNALATYAREQIAALPTGKPTIVLSDDPSELYLVEAAFQREGIANKNIMIETGSLSHREYIGYLVSRYPELAKLTRSLDALPRNLSSDAIIQYLYGLSKIYSIYYLNPSFGYYFEIFYLKPHGLVYELQPYQKDTLAPPLPAAAEIQRNQQFWAKAEQGLLKTLPDYAELDPDAQAVAGDYSVALNYWAVEMQKAGYLKEANALFTDSISANPQNFIAKINKQYNERLQKNDHNPIDTGDLVFKAINLYNGMVPILKYNGPVDEPGLDLDFGALMADGRDLRQASILFDRRLQLLPGDVPSELDLAKTYVDSGRPDKALDTIKILKANPKADRWEVARVEALAYFAKKDTATAERLMKEALASSPDDPKRLGILSEFYRVSGYAALREKNEKEANRSFALALDYVNRELQILGSQPAISGGPNSIPDVLLKKAELQMMLKSFKDSLVTLEQLMDLQQNNPTALLNHAVAEIQLKQFQAAKDDYKSLRKLLPHQVYVADFGLAEIAARESNTVDEIRYLKRYLDSAPDDTYEYQQAKKRLKTVESR
jgi:predicted Zn-dependent protease